MATSEAETLAEVARSVYLRRATGTVEHPGGGGRLYFRGGELYLERQHGLAAQLAPVLERLAGSSARPAADEELRRLTLAVMWQLFGKDDQAQFSGGSGRFPTGILGPLATILLVMELAVHDRGEAGLLARLGGEQARYRNSGDSPALQQLPGLEPEMAQTMAHLETPTPVAQILHLAGGDHRSTLQALAKLRAAGLIEAAGEPRRGTGTAPRQRAGAAREGSEAGTWERGARREGVLTARVLELFSDRITEDLAVRGVGQSIAEHRAFLAQLLAQLDALDHYRLLGIEPTAEEGEIHDAYRRLARRVHPVHARRLDLESKDEALRVLFERATEAYLVLSDPRRRSSYNLLTGIRVEIRVDPEKREEEKRQLARESYRLATHYMSKRVMDYGRAVMLLEEAVRFDPQPEYLAQLAQAQAHNPQLRGEALETFQKIIGMRPEDVGLRLTYANLLEGLGELHEARVHYQKVVELMPENPAAREALERLVGGRLLETGVRLGDGIRNLLKRG